VGAFGKPSVPDLPGIETFQGRICHTADWPDDFDIVGRRVAVVGNGASAMQLVPAIADLTSHLVVIQRTPHWVAPFEKFHRPIPEPLRWLLESVPIYRLWYRIRLNWIFDDRTHLTLRRDPNWPHRDRSMNAKNDRQRQFFEQYMREQLQDRLDLLDDLVPAYPPFGKRMLFDNGWFRTVARDDVTLNTSAAVELKEHSIVAGDGQEYDVDGVIFATGFDVVRFLSTLDLYGRGGVSIREAWDDEDCRAYLGMAVPEFPNFFMLYGPNVQSGHGGSLLAKIEMQTRYIAAVLQHMVANDLSVVECRREVYERYDEEIQNEHAEMVWTHPGVRTYYRNSRGRVVQNLPLRNIEYMRRIEQPDFDDYLLEPRIDLPDRAVNA
jgi:4-hydroxyacetophenone monooxygenase